MNSRHPFFLFNAGGVLLILIAFFGLTFEAKAATLVLSVSDDMIRSDNATTNFSTGTNDQLGTVPSPAKLRDLFSINLSSLPGGATVQSATLSLTTYGTDGSSSTSNTLQLDLVPITTTFVSSQATWNNAATGTSWTTPGGDYNNSDLLSSASANPVTITPSTVVTFASTSNFVSLVQTDFNSSTSLQFLLKLDTENTAFREIFDFASSNYSISSYQPYLTLTYTVPEPSTLALASMSLVLLLIGLRWKACEASRRSFKLATHSR